MKLLLILTLTSLLLSTSAAAGIRNRSAGTRTTTNTVGGQQVQRMETEAEANPLPEMSNALESVRSRPLPNSGRVNSFVRWVSNDAAAIGQDVAINADGNHPFVGWNLNDLRVSFHNNISNTPSWEYLSDPLTYRNFVSLSANSTIVANASYHNLYLFDVNTGAVTFSFTPEGSRIAGPVAVSRDGSLMVCATMAPLAGGIHRVYAFNPSSTIPVWTFDFGDALSTGVYGISISIDNSTVAVNGKFHAWLLNANDGTVRTEMEIANTESRLALSADASVLAIAELSGFIKAFNWNATTNHYDLLWQYKIPAGAFTNWASAVDVSADGLTIMGGSLIFLSAGSDGSIYLFDTFGEGTPNWIYTGTGDEVSGIALSDDGSLGAAITWGDINDNTKPTTLIFERGSNQPVYTVSSPGSMFSLAMSPDGGTVVAGGKHVHARTFGNGGDVYNIGVDLGGGAIAGTVLLGGTPPNFSGTTVEVLGTTKSATTLPSGQYVVPNVPAGTYSVRISHLGFVATTLGSITVVGTDTTQNANATLVQTGAAPTNLVASHSLNSRIQLSWTNPTSPELREYEHVLATDDNAATDSRAIRNPNAVLRHAPIRPVNSFVPPDSIRIYRAIRTGGPYYRKRTLPGPAAGYVDSSALPLKDYYYRITAVYGAGESVYSNEASGSVDSSFLQFSLTAPHRTVTPTFDGILSPGEWSDAYQVDVSDVFGNGGGTLLPRGSVFMYFKYDSVAKKIYIAGEDFLNNDGIANSEGFGLYFDDNNDNQFGPLDGDPLLREGNYWAYYFSTGPTVRFREIYSNGGVSSVIDTVTDAQVAMSSGSGHFVGEVSIPIGFFNKNHLQVYGPDKTVGAGLFMIGRDGGGGAIFHGWWPQTMTGVFTPSGFGDIHIPIDLLAPPRAPKNVTLIRQGTALVFSWTDPTHGINGDPLSVTPILEITRNGEVIATLPPGVQTYRDSNVVPQGWYEYKIRGGISAAGSDATFYGPYSETVGEFAVSSPQLSEISYDDGIPEVFYVVDFTYNDNRFGIRFSPQDYPAKVYRVKAFTNNGNKPILVSIFSDSAGVPGHALTGQYPGESHQTAGVDSFVLTIPAADPPTIASGDFWVVLNYLPTSPEAPGIGGDYSAPIDARTLYYTSSSGWVQIPNVDLIVRAFVAGPPLVVDEDPAFPTVYALSQNYPNPFNPSTTIKYDLPADGHMTLKVYDLLGKEVLTLVDKQVRAGHHGATFDASGFSSGIYFYQMRAGAFLQTRKLILMK